MLPLSQLDTVVSAAYLEGRSRYGNLGLELTAYSERIDFIVKKNLGPSPDSAQAEAFVKSLHLCDLYLATACAQFSPGHNGNGKNGSAEHASAAWKILETTYRGFVYDLVRFFYRPGFISQDLADNVIGDLFLPDRSGTSRIASYDARSSLSTWLRVIVCNRSINAQRCTANAKSTDIQPEMPDQPALENIEMTLRARRYRAALEDSLGCACRKLTPRERLVLLWRYEDGLQLGQIAKLLGIHQSNVTRQLERMQSKLRDDVIAVLSTKHGLSRSAIKECLEDVTENPRHQISILDFLKVLQQPNGHGVTSMPAAMTPEIYKAGHKPALNPVNTDMPKGA